MADKKELEKSVDRVTEIAQRKNQTSIYEEITGPLKRNTPTYLRRQRDDIAKWAETRPLTKAEVLTYYKNRRQWDSVKKGGVKRGQIVSAGRLALAAVLIYPSYRAYHWLLHPGEPVRPLIKWRSNLEKFKGGRYESHVELPGKQYELSESFSPVRLQEGSLDDIEDVKQREYVADALTLHEPIPKSNRYRQLLVRHHLNPIQRGMQFMRFKDTGEHCDLTDMPRVQFFETRIDAEARRTETMRAIKFDGSPEGNKGERWYSHFEREGYKEWHAKLRAMREQEEQERAAAAAAAAAAALS